MIINKNNCKCKVTIQPETIVQIMRRVYASVRHTGCAISSHRTSHAAIAAAPVCSCSNANFPKA